METFKEIIAGAIITLIAVAIIALPIYWVAKYSCEQHWRDAGFESRFGVFAGCQLYVDGRWIPSEVYRVVP